MQTQYGYRCQNCRHLENRFVEDDDKDNQICGVWIQMFTTDEFHCPTKMERLPCS